MTDVLSQNPANRSTSVTVYSLPGLRARVVPNWATTPGHTKTVTVIGAALPANIQIADEGNIPLQAGLVVAKPTPVGTTPGTPNNPNPKNVASMTAVGVVQNPGPATAVVVAFDPQNQPLFPITISITETP